MDLAFSATLLKLLGSPWCRRHVLFLCLRMELRFLGPQLVSKNGLGDKLEKYQSAGMVIPNIRKNKSHVPVTTNQ